MFKSVISKSCSSPPSLMIATSIYSPCLLFPHRLQSSLTLGRPSSPTETELLASRASSPPSDKTQLHRCVAFRDPITSSSYCHLLNSPCYLPHSLPYSLPTSFPYSLPPPSLTSKVPIPYPSKSSNLLRHSVSLVCPRLPSLVTLLFSPKLSYSTDRE